LKAPTRITGIKCDGLFDSGKCQFYRDNDTNIIGELSYQSEVCNARKEPLSPGEISGIVIGVVSLLVAIVGIWYNRRQLKLTLKQNA